MSLLKSQKDKSVLVLVLISAIASVLFSFLGAPFMRALFVSTKSRTFWTTAAVLFAAMLVVGIKNHKILETAVYVGSIWMTLGTYSELEKRGISWLNSGLVSICTGFFFALAGYFLVLKNLTSGDLLAEIVKPLSVAMNKAIPESAPTADALVKFLPGIFIASLFGSLAISFAYEDKVTKLFKIQRERIASGLRWLEFRLPSFTIWTALVTILITELIATPSLLHTLGFNILIVLTVAFFFQGLAVVASLLRIYRVSPIFRTITYLLIFLQLAPFIVFVGFADYWADFRSLVIKKTKTTLN